MPRTIPDLLADAVARHGAAPALAIADARGIEVWSYRRLARIVAGLAGRLRDGGVGRGARVGLIGDNGPEWTAGYLAIVQTGATAVPLDPGERPADNRARLERAGARAVLLGRRVARPDGPPPPEPDLPPGLPRVGLCDALPEGPVVPTGAEPDAVATLLFTSGTTDDPRAVPLTHRALVTECDALSRVTPLPTGVRTIAIVPLHHVFGFNVGLMLPLAHGGLAAFLPELSRSALLEGLRAHRPHALCAVPAVWSALRAGIEADVAARGAVTRLAFRAARGLAPAAVRRLLLRSLHRRFGGALRTLVSSGAPFEAAEVAFWRSLGFTMLHAYGLTETTGAVTCTRPGDAPDAGVGRPLAGVELRILDVGPDGVGEIAVRGPTVMAGYEDGASGLTRLDDGWQRTGDLGRVDAAGNLHLTGRSREVIVRRGGETIRPEAIEEHLAAAPHVAEVAVVGSGPPGDERPLAVLVADEAAMERDGILDVFGTVRYQTLSRAASLPAALRPAGYRIHPGPLPRTPTRKLRRLEIRRRVERGAAGWGFEEMTSRRRGSVGEVALANHGDPVANAVMHALGRVLRAGAPQPQPRHHLGADLGLDSMDRIDLVCRLESELGRKLPDGAIQAATVDALVRAVRGALPGHASTPLEVLATRDAAADAALERAASTARRLWPVRAALLRLFRGIGRACFDIRVEGLQHVPREGPFLLCANHQSYIDPYFLIPALPREVRDRLWIVAVEWLFRGPLSTAYLHTARTLPMDNRGRFLPGLRTALRVLERGEGLLIFPEGMRSFDGRVGPWRPGAGLLALQARVPLVPLALAGAYQVLPPGSRFPRLRDGRGGRPQVRIAVGEPWWPERLAPGEDTSAAAQRVVDRMRDEVLRLMALFPETLRPEAAETVAAAERAAKGSSA